MATRGSTARSIHAAVALAAVLTLAVPGEVLAQYGSRSDGDGASPGYGQDAAPPPRPRQPPRAASGVNAPPARPGPPGPPLQRSATGVPPADETRLQSNEVVIELAGNPTPQAVDALASRHGLVRIESQSMALTGTTYYRWRIPDGRSVSSVLRELEADRAVTSAQPNYVYTLQQSSAPNGGARDIVARDTVAREGDPAQYALAKLHLPEAHSLARGDKVLVAVIDSAIDTTHPELADVVVDQFDASGSAPAPHPHGTGIAGVIAAHSRLAGAAPAAHILAVRAFSAVPTGAEGTTFNIVKGIDWAIQQGARIVNMSFAGPFDPALARLLAGARARGAILIAAAGNAGPKAPPQFPAADPNVIAVTATDADDHVFALACRGNYIALAAPGVDILAPAPGGSYQVTSGTSFAAAYVSGIAALILERRPKLLLEPFKHILLSTAHDLGPKGRDDAFGEGLADAYQALLSLEPKASDTTAAGDQVAR
jgi:subtilisin family serine protease